MDNVFKERRFSNVLSNPRFKKMPHKERKVTIDKRFQSMFTDKRFQVKFKVDERGRKIDELQADNYKKYYEISDSDPSDSSDHDSSEETEKVSDSNVLLEKPSGVLDDKDPPSVSNPQKQSGKESEVDSTIDVGLSGEYLGTSLKSDISAGKDESKGIVDKTKIKEQLMEAHKKVNKYIDEIHKVKLNDKIREKLSDVTVDYARGIGTLLSGSESSSDESSSEESDVETIEHPWGELDKDAETTEEISNRLAICNMDWDRVTAKDLMVLFNSFLPSSGIIESVTIYPSEFGLARMAEEEVKGPKELVESKESFDIESDEDIEEGSSYQREKLREYQLKRLKYYYAVVVCNSKEVANTLYSECDGLEYESSATKLDLRFIGDDVTFDQKPRDVCTALPDLKKYKPRLFINTALQQGKVDLTWDETDPDRIDFTRKVLAGDEVGENEIQVYLASSSSEDEGVEEKKVEAESDEEGKTDQERIMKYRALISNLQESRDKKKGDVEMEVSWGPDSVSNDRVESIENGPSKFNIADSDEESSNAFSDEDEKKNIKRKERKKSKKMDVLDENSEDEKNNAELELLLADDNPDETGRHHFSLKAIQKEEKDSKKKKKWRKNIKKKTYQEEDTFKINSKDDRFSALFTSHHFNIDPADPHFRKTKAMNELIQEKQKRLKMS